MTNDACLFLRSSALAVASLLAIQLATLQAEELALIGRIAFGSCVHQDRPQPIWDEVIRTRPEAFLLIGDNIYGDSADMRVLKGKYHQLGSQPGYQRLLATCPLYATWDDHDYGLNDGGVEFEQKAASQQVFNDFFGVAADSPRRQRPGIYDAIVSGPPGKRVQLILLDTRYFRSPLKRWTTGTRNGRGPYLPDDDSQATMLGAAQWSWLEEELKKPAELRIVASSVQVVPEQHGWEMWANFPADRRRLFHMIRETAANGVIFISGDRHLAEISCLSPTEAGPGYPLYDLTSSSLNVPSGGGNENEANRHRIGQHYLKENFATIHIDWNQADPPIRLAIHDIRGEIVRQQNLSLSKLQAASHD